MKHRDYRGAAGNIACGPRRVRPGGIVKFDRCFYQAEELKGMVGEWVIPNASDPWLSEYVAVDYYPFGPWFCYATLMRDAAGNPSK